MMTDDLKTNFSHKISRLIADAEETLAERQHAYIYSQEYYNGIMRDVPSVVGSSSVGLV
ncbi:hypothetical protein LSO9J_80051 [Candidatus Liberibacter solanacearum]|uniref:hypothetical protein n=1 Tax=Candidatus Liberibacter solanacearum TaxID=556287 RepID=UPI003871FCF1